MSSVIIVAATQVFRTLNASTANKLHTTNYCKLCCFFCTNKTESWYFSSTYENFSLERMTITPSPQDHLPYYCAFSCLLREMKLVMVACREEDRNFPVVAFFATFFCWKQIDFLHAPLFSLSFWQTFKRKTIRQKRHYIWRGNIWAF